MGNRRIAPDIKLAAIRLYREQLLDVDDILRCLDLSRSTFFRALKLWRDTGDIVGRKPVNRGRPRLLNREDLEYLLDIIQANPERFLDELQPLLKHNRFISVHFTTILHELERAGVTHKKLTRIAEERNEYARADFVIRIAQYDPRSIGFIDETSKDERTICRRHGWSQAGTRAESHQVFVRGRRFTTTALLTLDGISGGTVVEGSMTREMFLEFLENIVLPKCTPYPGPGLNVLVLDNAKIHHGEEIRELTERFGVRIEYLPPYSPDLNPIEEAFSKIKHFLRRHQDYYSRPQGDGLMYDLLEVLQIITTEDAHGYYIHAGYF